MKKRKKKEDLLISISAGILLVIIALSGFYVKISNEPEKEAVLKGKIGELYSGGNSPPIVSLMSPQFIEAYPQTGFSLNVSYSDSDGINDLNYVRLIINKGVGTYPNYTAKMDYFPSSDKLTIYEKGEENNLIAHYAFEENLN
ncbi:MAG: hypothetical protein PHF67_02995 [Candidatus Nanoarchaeia archaeon]|nr:hypothetical protein [Candidatus Nanoarchaeia archaeon]